MIDKVIILSQKVNSISEGAENLYYRIYVNTDDFGLFHADSRILKGQVYTLRDISVEIIESRLDELIKIELIKIYKHNDEKYLEIVDFDDHQTFRKDYKRKREYPEPNTKSYESVQSSTKSPTKLNQIKLNQIKLKEDTETTETLILLSKVKNYPYDAEKDLEFIKGLKTDFPDVDVIEKIKQVVLNWLNFPLVKKSRPRVQIRRWVTNEQKWQKEGEKEKKVGAPTHAPSRKEENYTKARAIKMKELEKKYQSEREKAMTAKSSEWMDEIDNKIKEEIAEFSREYHKKEE